MILKNDPVGAANYEWRGVWGATSSITIASPMCYGVNTGSTEIIWGLGLAALVTGMRVEIYTRGIDPTIVGDTGYYSITFKCPWQADLVITANSELATEDWLIQADDVTLTGGCNDFIFSFSELRFYVGGVLKSTIAAQSDPGATYDPRLNSVDEKRDSFIGGTSPLPPTSGSTNISCAGTFAAQQAYSLQSSGGLQGGWRYRYGAGAWITPDVWIELPPYPDDSLCGCAPSLGAIVYTNSWDVALSALWSQVVAVTDLGLVTTHCTGVEVRPKITHDWSVTESYQLQGPEVTLARKDCNIRQHSEAGTLYCTGTITTLTNSPVTDTFCHSKLTYTAINETATIYCMELIQECLCALGGTCIHTLPSDFFCYEGIVLVVGWPVEPGCGSIACFNIEDDMGRLHVAYIIDGDVWYKRSDNSRGAGGFTFDHKITSNGACIRAHFDYDAIYKRVELYFETSMHDVYYMYSVGDEGETWHAVSLFGSNMTNLFTKTNHFNDDRIRCWFEYDAGTSGPGKAKGQYRRYSDSAWSSVFTFTSSGSPLSVADGGMCNVDFAFSNQGELVWNPIINGDTTPASWFSNDEGRTWRLQP